MEFPRADAVYNVRSARSRFGRPSFTRFVANTAPGQCDELFPCRQCRQRNIFCSGHVPRLRFRFASQMGLRQYGSRVWNVASISNHIHDPQVLRPIAASASTSLASRLITAMDQTLPTGFRLDSCAGFFTFVPSRLGRVAALDDATDCMLAVHSEYLSMARSGQQTSRAKYVRAIRSLQTCLSDATTRTSSEVICAILLLGYNEVRKLALVKHEADVTKYFLGLSPGGFSYHVQGAYQLIQIRGQATFNDDFEKSILHANASDIVSRSAFHTYLLLI